MTRASSEVGIEDMPSVVHRTIDGCLRYDIIQEINPKLWVSSLLALGNLQEA